MPVEMSIADEGKNSAPTAVDVRDVLVIAPNLKVRLSGVTSTIVQLLPVQRRTYPIAALGPGLPDDLPRMRWHQLLNLMRKPRGKPFRIWHARRNVEMFAGILLRDVLRAPLRLVFTSAAQRRHRAFTRFLMRRMDAVIATSRFSAGYLSIPHTVVRHGVDCHRFHPPRDESDQFNASGLAGKFAVGCSGRIRPDKGTDLFVESMIRLLPKYPEWTAILTGRVTIEHRAFFESLKAKIAAAGLNERIVFLGEVADVRLWFRRMSLYIAPSRMEGFGLTPLEAMASHTAVIASDAGAYRELIDPGVTGQIVPAGDLEALIAAIEPYLADPSLAGHQGSNAVQHVRARFAIESEAEQIAQVYERLWASGR